MKTNKIYISVALILGIIIIVNLLSDQYFIRLDFTEDKQYTLSRATKNILKELNDPVTVTAYFSKDLPPDVARGRKDFREMLIEYNNISNGMLVYEFIDPTKDELKEMEVMQSGIQPVMINVREKDQMKQQKAYMGALVQLGEQIEVLPFIQPGVAMEYALSTAIKKISVIDKPSVGLLQGHGEPAINELQQVSAELSILYTFEPVSLSDTTSIPDHFKTLAIVRPTDSLPSSHLDEIDEFLARGGRLFIALNMVKGDFSTAYGSSVNTGLETWLRNKGLQIENNFVVDVSCGSVTVQQQQGVFTFSSQVSFPYIPIINTFTGHPITEGLEAVILQFASSISYIGDSTKVFTPIAMTSKKSGSLPVPQYFDIQKQWTELDFPLKNLAVGGILEGNLVGNIPSKMVIITDGDFVVNGPRGQQLQPDNISLMVNSIDWLSDDTGLIELRTKGVTYRPLNQLEDGTKTFLKYLNFLLPIILVVVYGLIRIQQNRNVRIKRLEESYV
jgi:gliding-associated putative ABC transporter substrate-binding component GldG